MMERSSHLSFLWVFLWFPSLSLDSKVLPQTLQVYFLLRNGRGIPTIVKKRGY